jgi:pilus assembly protein Flp/PilA
MAREKFRERRQEFSMRRLLARFVGDECGATAIEYALIAAGISIVIVTAVNGMGSALSAKYVEVGASIK